MVEPQERVAYKAYPLAFCAGVDWSYKNALKAVGEEPGPVYGVGTIVNNNLVVGDLERRGMVFVERPEEVPKGSVAVISAHGLSLPDRQNLRERQLKVIDSTCPLVETVHDRVARALTLAESQGQKARILYICKEKDLASDHKEVRGVIGDAPENIVPITNVQQIKELDPVEGEMYFVDTQTTLNIDTAREWMALINERIPGIKKPPLGDVCYATKNRQNALKLGLSRKPDLMIAFGSTISSNTGELVRMGREHGVRGVHLLETADLVTPEMVADSWKILITAGASAPPEEPDKCLEQLGKWGYRVEELRVATEPQYFDRIPKMEDNR